MKTTHKLFIASAVALPFVGLAGTAVHAATTTSANTGSATEATNPMSNLVAKIAAKFNLNTSDVQAVFDENRTANRAAMQAKVAAALKTAGFTDSQITALQIKQSEQRDANKAWRAAHPNATQTEKKAHHDSEETAMEAWAKEQGIDMTKVQDALETAGIGHMGGRGHGEMMGSKMDNDSSGTESAN
jgi:hypothetical protein